jgi:glycosyltransferase involved in cell wall biosynthesis
LTSNEKYPVITVVTPNYNQGDFLERTILSVLDQKYPNLEYIIIDGGSTDNSEAIIKKFEDRLHYWVSEKDDGMYYAINKGFSKSSGEIMCWINSDDVLWEYSLFKIAELFSALKHMQWLQGYPSVIDEQGELMYQREPVSSKYHYYLGIYRKDFSFIQQESTFWRRGLWERSGGKLNTKYGLAADFDLWMRFFKYAALYCTKQQLAAFRKREGQKSGDGKQYLQEANASVKYHLKNLDVFSRIKIKMANNFGSNIFSESVKWIKSND